MFGIQDFLRYKEEKKPICMATAYDAWGAALLAESGVDAALVGDSAAMVVHGYSSTLHATMDMMLMHTSAVRRGAPSMFIVADLPFLSTRTSLADSVRNAGSLMQAGANAVKIEGLRGHEELIPHLVASGIPVMGHIGLQPQQIEVLGAWKVQGKDASGAERLEFEARELCTLGCFSMVLECVPNDLAQNLTQVSSVATIGIGAGPDCDGQILVFHDLLGLNQRTLPRFVRTFAQGKNSLSEGLKEYASAVHAGTFPSPHETYGNRPLTQGSGGISGVRA